MSILPATPKQQVEFFEGVQTAWQEHASEIGLDSLAVNNFISQIQAARAAYAESLTLRSASKAGTQGFYNAVNAMLETGREFLQAIKLHADETDDPDVYRLAEIPLPKTPTELPAPDSPTDATASLNVLGEVSLKWKGSLFGGTAFTVDRRIEPPNGAPGPWTLIGTTQKKSYTDGQVPQGAAAVSYRIRAIRHNIKSDNAVIVSAIFGSVSGATNATATFETTVAKAA